MILDALLTFTGTGGGTPTGTVAAAQWTDAPTTGTQVSSQVIDLGLVGLPTSANGGGARDIGIGDAPSMKLSILVTTVFGGGTDLTVNLQGAPDNGSGAPSAYTTMWNSPAYAEATMVLGEQLANVDVPMVIAGQVLPRYLRLQYVSTGTHTGGAIEANIVIDRDDQITGTGGVYSGYRAGITVAN